MQPDQSRHTRSVLLNVLDFNHMRNQNFEVNAFGSPDHNTFQNNM